MFGSSATLLFRNFGSGWMLWTFIGSLMVSPIFNLGLRTVWILENHLDFLPQRRKFRRISWVRSWPSKTIFPRWLFPIEEYSVRWWFSAARFSHQPQGFTSFDAEVDAIHRFDQRNILIEEKSFRNQCIFNPWTSGDFLQMDQAMVFLILRGFKMFFLSDVPESVFHVPSKP